MSICKERGNPLEIREQGNWAEAGKTIRRQSLPIPKTGKAKRRVVRQKHFSMNGILAARK